MTSRMLLDIKIHFRYFKTNTMDIYGSIHVVGLVIKSFLQPFGVYERFDEVTIRFISPWINKRLYNPA